MKRFHILCGKIWRRTGGKKKSKTHIIAIQGGLENFRHKQIRAIAAFWDVFGGLVSAKLGTQTKKKEAK